MSSQKVRDPVCGMMVDPAKSVKVVLDEETYFLCSEHCASQLKAMKSGRSKW